MINCDKLKYLYKSSREGLESLTMTMNPGNIYGLLGKNGSGKTTLLRIISGVLFSQSGSCSIKDVPVKNRDQKILENFYIFPEDIYVLSMQGEKFVNYYSKFYPSFDRDYFNELAVELDIKDTFTRSLYKVSQGQRKKVFVAFALATKVQFLFFDEPTNSLDIPSRTAFKSIIYRHSIKNNQIVLISTHNIKDIESLVNCYVFIDQGKHLFNLFTEDIFKNFTLQVHQEEIKKDALHTCKIVGGYASLFEEKKEEAKEFDLEVFFTIVWNSQEVIDRISQLYTV